MMKLPTVSYPVKLTILGTTVGVALIGLLAAYFRRRKKRRPYRDIASEDITRSSRSFSHHSYSTPRSPGPGSHHSHSSAKSPNGDLLSLRYRRSTSPSTQRSSSHHSRSNSVSSHGASSVASTIRENSYDTTDNMSPEQLCERGMETLLLAVQQWEDALDRIEGRENASVLDTATSHLHAQLRYLVEKALRMRDEYEQKVIRQVSGLVLDTAMTAITETEAYRDERRRSFDSTSDDLESFVSATDMADLSDLEEQKSSFHHLVLYETGLLELEHGDIPCRTLRTKMLKCGSDTEFLAKLFCVRMAFQEMFKDETICRWFVEMGKELIGGLLSKAERDTEEFSVSYDSMIEYCMDPENYATTEDELRGRGVKCMSFFDVVVDFILLDAFDDLEDPMPAVTRVIQNRWLSNGIKETALATAVWSVLKAKRSLLKYRNGFIAHLYAISEHVTPLLVWGLLGPDGPLQDICFFFKDQVLGFIQDVFDFEKVRYTSVEHMIDDIINLARDRRATSAARLS